VRIIHKPRPCRAVKAKLYGTMMNVVFAVTCAIGIGSQVGAIPEMRETTGRNVGTAATGPEPKIKENL